MIEVEKVRSSIEIMQKKDDIERQENNNRKDSIVMERTTPIETIQKNPSAIIQKNKLDIIDEDKEKGMERQGNSILKLTNSKETLRKELDIEKT